MINRRKLYSALFLGLFTAATYAQTETKKSKPVSSEFREACLGARCEALEGGSIDINRDLLVDFSRLPSGDVGTPMERRFVQDGKVLKSKPAKGSFVEMSFFDSDSDKKKSAQKKSATRITGGLTQFGPRQGLPLTAAEEGFASTDPNSSRGIFFQAFDASGKENEDATVEDFSRDLGSLVTFKAPVRDAATGEIDSVARIFSEGAGSRPQVELIEESSSGSSATADIRHR